MFPPDCVANRLCSRVAEEVNGQHEFAGGGVAQQARLAKHVEMGIVASTYGDASRLPTNSLKVKMVYFHIDTYNSTYTVVPL